MDHFPFLELAIALPLLGAFFLSLIPEEDDGAIRGAALATTVCTFLVSLPLFWLFDPAVSGMQLVSKYDWLPKLGASFSVGVDGISLLLVLLTTFLGPVAVLASWKGIRTRVKTFHVALLILEAATVGVFCARDLLLFFLFYEVMLAPMFLLIGVWGGENRIAAALKFFVFTAVGGLLMLAAIVYVYTIGGHTFDLDLLAVNLRALRASGELGLTPQFWLCLAFAIAFAIKVPVFPAHTWLPHAHVQAPTAGSVVLAAVLLKMGGYGFLRFCLPLFPDGARELAPAFLWLGVIGVVYGAFMALAQSDLKRLIAYSSVSHLGLVVVGIFAGVATVPEVGANPGWAGAHARALTGSVFQMVAHGLSTGALFFLVGAIYDRRHTKAIAELGGLARPAPVLATVFVISTLASIAVPGTCGFVGELLILFGTFENHHLAAALGATGMVLGATYMLWAVQRVFFGPAKGENATMSDIDLTELAAIVPLCAAMIGLGLFPGPFLARLETAVASLAAAYGGG